MPRCKILTTDTYVDDLSDDIKYMCLLEESHDGICVFEIVAENIFRIGLQGVYREGFGRVRGSENEKRYIHKGIE